MGVVGNDFHHGLARERGHGDGGRNRSGGRGVVPQLVVAVEAPPKQQPILGERQHVVVAAGDLGDDFSRQRAARDHGNGHQRVNGRTHAELAVAVVAPGVDLAVAGECGGTVHTTGDGDDRLAGKHPGQAHGHRHRGVDGGAVAKLATVVLPPSEELVVAGEDQGVVVAGGVLDDGFSGQHPGGVHGHVVVAADAVAVADLAADVVAPGQDGGGGVGRRRDDGNSDGVARGAAENVGDSQRVDAAVAGLRRGDRVGGRGRAGNGGAVLAPLVGEGCGTTGQGLGEGKCVPGIERDGGGIDGEVKGGRRGENSDLGGGAEHRSERGKHLEHITAGRGCVHGGNGIERAGGAGDGDVLGDAGDVGFLLPLVGDRNPWGVEQRGKGDGTAFQRRRGLGLHGEGQRASRPGKAGGGDLGNGVEFAG